MMQYQYVGIGASCNPQPIQTRETQVKWQVFISLITKQWNSTTSALEFYHIKLLAECGVCTFFLYSFCRYTIRNDLRTISQYQKFAKFWKWSAACVILRIKGTGSFVPPSLANWSFVFRWSISRSSPAKTIEKKKKGKTMIKVKPTVSFVWMKVILAVMCTT